MNPDHAELLGLFDRAWTVESGGGSTSSGRPSMLTEAETDHWKDRSPLQTGTFHVCW